MDVCFKLNEGKEMLISEIFWDWNQ